MCNISINTIFQPTRVSILSIFFNVELDYIGIGYMNVSGSYISLCVNLLFVNFQSKLRHFVRLIILCLHIITNKVSISYPELPWVWDISGYNSMYLSSVTSQCSYDSIPLYTMYANMPNINVHFNSHVRLYVVWRVHSRWLVWLHVCRLDVRVWPCIMLLMVTGILFGNILVNGVVVTQCCVQGVEGEDRRSHVWLHTGSVLEDLLVDCALSGRMMDPKGKKCESINCYLICND